MASDDGKPEKLQIVLIGDGGSGKSATGNTILGKRAFTTRQSQDTETLTCQAARGEFEGTPVSVVDTPGTIRPNTDEMSKCISCCAPGPHAFLLVIPLEKCTDLERQEKNLQQTFGEEASRYTIVLFTHGDKLPDGVSAELRSHVRYHVFNNRIEDPSQVRELLDKINTMVQVNGGSYCIKVKDRKHKYLYPFARAVAFGGSFGAASGGTGEGVLVTVVGSVVGAGAAHLGGNTAVYVAVAIAAAVAVICTVVGAGLVAVTGFEGFFVAVAVALGGRVAVNIVRAGAKAVAVHVALAVAATVAVAVTLLVTEDNNVAVAVVVVVAAAGAVVTRDVEVVDIVCLAAVGVACIAGAGARAGAAAVGFADALRAGVVTGVRVAAIAAAAIFIGARGEAAAFRVFHDVQSHFELLGIIGGAGVGAGVSAAVGVYADGAGFVDFDNLVFAGFGASIGGLAVLSALNWIAREAASTIDKITACATVAGVSAVAAFGAAAGYCWHNNTLQPVVWGLLAAFTSSSSSNMTMPQ